MKRIFEDVIGRNELIANYPRYDYEAALISIWSPGDYDKLKVKDPEHIHQYHKAKDFFTTSIRQEFWDTEDNVVGYPTISPEQAVEMVDFILDNRSKVFIIHCDAGQSRSAGVALAVECIINYDGDLYEFGKNAAWVNCCPRYSPNRKVYDKIMVAYKQKNQSKKDENEN